MTRWWRVFADGRHDCRAPHLAADLKALRLSTVAAQWQPLAEQAVRQRQTPADYLAQLVHLEVTAPPRAPHPAPHPGRPLPRPAGLRLPLRRRGRQRRVRRRGPYGGRRICRSPWGWPAASNDYRVRFVTAAELVTMLVEAQQQGRLARKLAQLARYDVVHVD